MSELLSSTERVNKMPPARGYSTLCPHLNQRLKFQTNSTIAAHCASQPNELLEGPVRDDVPYTPSQFNPQSPVDNQAEFFGTKLACKAVVSMQYHVSSTSYTPHPLCKCSARLML